MNRRRSSLLASPVLVGAAGILIALVTVVLAYNANSGLPFVATYDVKVELPDGQKLTPGSDVRLGGARIGAVDDIAPKVLDDGRIVALATLRLDKVADPLPADTTVLVRPRSALGLKFVELTRGRSDEPLEAGATLPVRQAKIEPVDLDQLSAVWDEETRDAFRDGFPEFAGAFAGRGGDINALLGDLPETMRLLSPVMRDLADPRTGLAAALRAFARAAGEVAPVADVQRTMLRHLAATFTALAEVSGPFQELVSTGVPLQRAVARELPATRGFMARSAELMRRLDPAFARLRTASGPLSSALRRGESTFGRVPRLADALDVGSAAIRRLADDPQVPQGLAAGQRTVEHARPILTALTPTQVRCNYISLFFRNAHSVIAEGSRVGTWQRSGTMIVPTWIQPVGEPTPDLHYNALPHTGQPGSDGDCEAGNEGYRAEQTIGNVPGVQATENDRTPNVRPGG
ncbi:MAG: MlaD family protein [Solirubrobacteraceae bacterium]|nr:MlaD family protein [Solirubrobacteraceae bacterium]